MAQEVYVYPNRVVDSDDKTATVNAVASTNGQKLVFDSDGQTFFRTRTGRRARLAFVGNAVDSGGETYITFHIYSNGNLLRAPYNSFQQALGETFKGSERLQVPIELPQNAMIEITVDNTDTNAYHAFARLRVEYEEF